MAPTSTSALARCTPRWCARRSSARAPTSGSRWLASVMQRYPQVLVNVRVREKTPLEQLPAVASMIGQIERSLGGEGRVLVRYSGTEAKARVMVEGPDAQAIRAWAEEIARALEQA